MTDQEADYLRQENNSLHAAAIKAEEKANRLKSLISLFGAALSLEIESNNDLRRQTGTINLSERDRVWGAGELKHGLELHWCFAPDADGLCGKRAS